MNPPSSIAETVARQAALAKRASRILATLNAAQKTALLDHLASAIEKAAADIVFHNEIDVEAAQESVLAPALIERLILTPASVQQMAQAVREIARQDDPVGEVLSRWTRPNGLVIEKIRVPLGVVGMIYESRPNVTVDAAALCLKSGNAVLLRGGSEAINSNRALIKVIAEALQSGGAPEGAVQMLADTSRDSLREMTRLPQWVDLVVARGSEEMIREVMSQATVPVLGHGKGVCHVYVDQEADLAMAQRIVLNAKVQRPGVCNAMETLLVHRAVAAEFLPSVGRALREAGVELRADEAARLYLPEARPATEDDWSAEYLALILSVRVVDSLEAAIDHIQRYGSGHSDAIVTRNQAHAERFLRSVDSAAVFHNASTRLHDGGVFGLGAEIGISTRKMHARGTMGARELTTTKYLVHGTGQIRE